MNNRNKVWLTMVAAGLTTLIPVAWGTAGAEESKPPVSQLTTDSDNVAATTDADSAGVKQLEEKQQDEATRL
ncbi:hypothetical protein [Granulosicoccus antarcticus]|uniref:hypothetical protein n=1 Tax=Granulosicoccus antarcticus TaxID=437505 RepID=UPI0012FE097B|nr:hypothetical protein [Granulosicoccus antarcticus]